MNHSKEVLEEGVSLEQAREHCSSDESSSTTAESDEAKRVTDELGPWFDGYEEE